MEVKIFEKKLESIYGIIGKFSDALSEIDADGCFDEVIEAMAKTEQGKKMKKKERREMVISALQKKFPKLCKSFDEIAMVFEGIKYKVEELESELNDIDDKLNDIETLQEEVNDKKSELDM